MTKRLLNIDILKFIGIICIIIAHTNPPKIIFQIRNFDVILMCIISIFLFFATLNMSFSLDFEYDDNSSLSSLIKSDDFINSIEIKDLLDSLDDNQRKVIVYKYYSGYSQSEIANIMNMSQSSVSRCEKESIELMRVRSR